MLDENERRIPLSFDFERNERRMKYTNLWSFFYSTVIRSVYHNTAYWCIIIIIIIIQEECTRLLLFVYKTFRRFIRFEFNFITKTELNLLHELSNFRL